MPDKDERAEQPRRAAQSEDEALYSYDEIIQSGPRFGVSSETVVGAIHAAGLQRKTKLTVSQVEEALKAFKTREVSD